MLERPRASSATRAGPDAVDITITITMDGTTDSDPLYFYNSAPSLTAPVLPQT